MRLTETQIDRGGESTLPYDQRHQIPDSEMSLKRWSRAINYLVVFGLFKVVFVLAAMIYSENTNLSIFPLPLQTSKDQILGCLKDDPEVKKWLRLMLTFVNVKPVTYSG